MQADAGGAQGCHVRLLALDAMTVAAGWRSHAAAPFAPAMRDLQSRVLIGKGVSVLLLADFGRRRGIGDLGTRAATFPAS